MRIFTMLALEKRYGFDILQTLERRAKLYFDYSIPLLEKLTTAAKQGPKIYCQTYEILRPREESEV